MNADHGVGRDRARRGIETIPHLTPRDSRSSGLESLLLGAHAEGMRNVLAVTGDPPEVGDYPGSRGVYEVDAIGLIELISRLNQGEDYNGRADRRADLVLPRRRRQPDRRRPRPRARPLPPQDRGGRALRDDAAPLRPRAPRPLLRALRRTLADPRLVGSARLELPASRCGSQRGAGDRRARGLQEALREAGPGAPEVGIAYAKELYEAAREKAAGVYLVAPYRRPLNVLELIA